MIIKTLTAVAAGAAALALASAATAQTQAPAAAPAAPPLVQGPSIPGLCTFAGDDAIVATTAVAAVFSKIDQEFATERTALQAEIEKAPKPVAEPLQKKVQAFQTKVSTRRSNLTPAEEQTVNRVAQQWGTSVREVYQQRRCSILLSTNAAIVPNPAMDITKAVIDSVNAKVK